MRFSTDLETNIKMLQELLPTKKSFDFFEQRLFIDNTPAWILCINGFSDEEFLQKIVDDLRKAPAFSETKDLDLWKYVIDKIGYVESKPVRDVTACMNEVLCGLTMLFVDGTDYPISMDLRQYPARGISEPDTERVSGGAKDGFVESLLTNATLIRRRIRSQNLIFSIRQLGAESATDVAVAYLDTKASPSLLQKLDSILNNLVITSLTMGDKSLEELILRKHWWNPMPSIRTTQRPDVASSYLLEGHVLLLVDNSPTALILPCTIFQFLQNPEDYGTSPIVGTYFRLIRFFCMPISLFVLPVFLLLGANYSEFCAKYNLIVSENPGPVRLFIYSLVIDFILVLFKYSSSISSGKYSGAMSIVGGLLISDMAVSLNWASEEILFYGGMTLLASLSISNQALSDAIRLYRLLLLLLTGFGGPIGFWIGVGLILLSIATTPTFGDYSYFWPLFPFNRKALHRVLFRNPTAEAQPVDVWSRGRAR